MKNPSLRDALDLRFDRVTLPAYAALGCTLAALWLLGRQYGGITHDATVYLAMALRQLEPERLEKDMFFLQSAQDAYTVFPLFYGGLINVLGSGAAALTVTVAGQLAFIAASATLAFRLASGPARWWALALLAVFSGYYGGVGVFRFAEPFATARTLAEPAVLASISWTLASRHRSALAALGAAALLHPLVAASGIAVVFFWHMLERPRLLWCIPFAGAVLFIVHGDWAPSGMWFDQIWLEAVVERSPHLFVAHWHLVDWARLSWGLCVLWLASRFLDLPARRLVLATVAATLSGLVFTWIAVDWRGSALAAGLQLWRVHWLMHLIAIMAVPIVVVGLWRSGNAGRTAAACVAASCCFGRSELPAAALLAMLAIIFDASERRSPGWMRERVFRFALLGLLCAASVGLLLEVQSRQPLFYGAVRPPQWTDYLHAAASVGGLLPLAGLLWLLAHSRFVIAAASMGAACLALGAAAWDARAPWNRFLEQAGRSASPLQHALPAGAQVFWPAAGGAAWQLLRAPSWYSVDQGAGIVFSRETALLYMTRKLASDELRASIADCATPPYQSSCRIGAGPAQALCERPDGPDYLVLNAPVEGHPGQVWTVPVPVSAWQRLYFYSCQELAK